jgi:carboxyl-terminal processing protease
MVIGNKNRGCAVKVGRVVIRLVIVLAILAGGFSAGIAWDRSILIPTASALEITTPPPGFGIFWEAWSFVQDHYVDRTALDTTRLTYGAIQGMLAALNDEGHTRFLTPAALKAEQDSLSGQLEGIGAVLGVRNGLPTVVAPIAGSPAQKAGIRPGDVIVKVDGKSVSSLSLDEVVRLVRGPEGTTVNLTINHRGETGLIEVSIVRAKLIVPNVTWAMLPGTKTGHVLISQFGERTSDELIKAIGQMKSAGATAIILDLRNNPGGLLNEAVGVASQFLREGTVLLEENAQGQRRPANVRRGGTALDIPMVVLVNEGSASASEIVAGAMQDHRRATLIGQTTIGTGTVLSTFNLSDGSAILLGIAQWLTPNGRQIWHNGIVPDIAVALPAAATPLLPEAQQGFTVQQLKDSGDTQLLRAMEELNMQAPIR